MSWPKIIAYYLVAAVLSFHLFGVWRERNPVIPVAAVTSEPFLVAVPERIDRVRFDTEELSVQFERRDGRWVITEPDGVSSPGDVIDAVLESLTGLAPIEVVSEGVDKEGQFGLSPPRVRVRLESEGEVVSNIVFGELNPTRTAVYARKAGKDEVVLLGLNPKYYIDLVFENVRRQKASSGIAEPSSPGGAGIKEAAE